MTYVFRVEDVRKAYNGRQVLVSAGVWVRRGSVTALLGRNGSGKTTMVEIALGWRRGNRGVVMLGDRRLTGPGLATLARCGVFYLPQRRWLSPLETVRTHFEALAFHVSDAKTAAAIDRLRLDSLLNRRPHELSGGERRRVELGLAVARRPTCLIADEPFLGIAPTDAALIGAMLRELAEAGCGVLVTGHELPQLLQVADFVIWVSAGATYDLGPVDSAMAHRQFVREYLGAQYEAT